MVRNYNLSDEYDTIARALREDGIYTYQGHPEHNVTVFKKALNKSPYSKIVSNV